jgi:signal transduction histidine kinase
MLETQDDLEELVPLRVVAIRSVQDKSESVEDMFDKADKVLAYLKYGSRGDTELSGDGEAPHSFTL